MTEPPETPEGDPTPTPEAPKAGGAARQLLGMKAKDTNQHLAACGLQIRNQRGEWELTDAGRPWGEALPYCRGTHSDYQILWNPAVVDVVRELG